jgi:S1-C subfamily serine protease
VRDRFVIPQDKSFIVFFEWTGSPGAHVLTGVWRAPNGQVDSISPDVKIESTTSDLSSYWTYILNPEMASGIWAFDVRIDGQPAGSHSFEIAGTIQKQTPNPTPASKPPTLEEIFRNTSPSLVRVRKLNAASKRVDACLGFVIAKDRIGTALQCIDAASKLEIELPGGRKLETDEIGAWSVSGDWAVIQASTGDLPAIETGDPKLVRVGERLIVFAMEGGAPGIGGVDISGKRTVPRSSERIQFSLSLSLEAAGGPCWMRKAAWSGLSVAASYPQRDSTRGT